MSMEIILLQNVANLGKVGDPVKVAPGFGRNFLIPQGKAVVANDRNIKMFETRREELEGLSRARIEAAEQRKVKLADVEINLIAQASDEGKLYGSVGPREVAEAVQAAGHELLKSEVSMPGGPIHYVGEHEVAISLHPEVSSLLKVIITAQS